MRRILGTICLLFVLGSCSNKPAAVAPPPASPSPSPSPVITKAAFIAQGNAICTQANVQQSAIPDPGTNRVKAAAAMRQVVGIIQNAVAQLKALPQPPADAATLQGLYAQVLGLSRSPTRRRTICRRAGPRRPVPTIRR